MSFFKSQNCRHPAMATLICRDVVLDLLEYTMCIRLFISLGLLGNMLEGKSFPYLLPLWKTGYISESIVDQRSKKFLR